MEVFTTCEVGGRGAGEDEEEREEERDGKETE